MDAYDLITKVKQIWMDNYNKNSGTILKLADDMPVRVNGKIIKDITFKDGCIELEVEND